MCLGLALWFADDFVMIRITEALVGRVRIYTNRIWGVGSTRSDSFIF